MSKLAQGVLSLPVQEVWLWDSSNLKISSSPESSSCLSSVPPNSHVDTFENYWYLPLLDDLLKQEKCFTKWSFIHVYIYRFWKGSFGEDVWGCATAAVWQEGCLPSEVFSPNFWDAASDTGPHPINWIAFPQEIKGEKSMRATDLAGFLCHCHVCAPCVWSEGKSSGAERDLPKSLLLSFCNDSRNLYISGFSSRLVIADFEFVIWLSCWLQQKSSLLHNLLVRTRCRKLVFHLSLYCCTTFSISSLPAISFQLPWHCRFQQKLQAHLGKPAALRLAVLSGEGMWVARNCKQRLTELLQSLFPRNWSSDK